MKAHLKYANYVARHKWFVFLAGIKTGAPLWRLIIHDWSKLTPAEWFPYVQKFYGHDRDELRDADAFDKAWLHHQHRNPHHWQHWLLREDDGDTIALPMPDALVREMVADWLGAGRAITGSWDMQPWYATNRARIALAPGTLVLADCLVAEAMRAYGIETALPWPPNLAAVSCSTPGCEWEAGHIADHPCGKRLVPAETPEAKP